MFDFWILPMLHFALGIQRCRRFFGVTAERRDCKREWFAEHETRSDKCKLSSYKCSGRYKL